MRFLPIALLCFCFFFLGCREDENDSPKIALEITVVDASSSTSAKPQVLPSANATVYVYLSEEEARNQRPAYTGKTNNKGVLAISLPVKDRYFFTAENGNARSSKNGYAIMGIFESEDGLGYAAQQTPPAQLGGIILMDYNGDGLVNDLDKNRFRISSGFTLESVNKLTLYISE
ncbi:hypothetical protein ACFSC6_01965 [Rufibacter sediminis]|uniref:Uncharacterized protein n=1 Tax=Rufibacter sediminis TaxID=2762756 RepID=A0ABR6VWT8_9BACT|nr:hypothetical protein [Rufibacter sediminis]MBC3541662.1 hypothetical protein [Rufibacter sediminis]